MCKFDRCIFISIAIGIWALAMTQVFKPSDVIASNGCGTVNNPCFVEVTPDSDLDKKLRTAIYWAKRCD